MHKKSKKTFLTMDVGGTSVTQGLLNSQGEVLALNSFATRSERPQQELIDEMISGFETLRKQNFGLEKPKALAFGMPGWLDQKKGLFIKAPNMAGWVNVAISKILGDALGLPAYLENDANLYALGEFLSGAGRGFNNQLTITLGTGVGGGLVLNGRLWNGSFASAGEIGHMPIDEHGSLCGCGSYGCLETISSATAMIRQGRKWLSDKKETQYQGRPEDLDAKVMYELAQKGDPMSLSVFAAAGHALGLALSSIFNLLGLEIAIIGGGAAGAFELIKPHIMDVFEKRLITAQLQDVAIVKGLLGDKAPLAGAVALLLQFGH